MNHSELQARTTLLLSFAGYTDVLPAPDYAALVNRGLYDFSWDTEYNRVSAVFETVVDQAEYTLPAPYFRHIHTVIHATDNPLRRTTEAEQERNDALWAQRTNGTPAYWMVVRPNVIRLHPKPSASSVAVTVRGTRAASPLVGDNDSPDFPDYFHEAIALRAAVLHMQFAAQGEETKRLAFYVSEYQRFVREFKSYLGDARFGDTPRVVAAPSRRRVGIC